MPYGIHGDRDQFFVSSTADSNADKHYIYAYASASAVAKTAYAIRATTSGHIAVALFDTTFASTTAASHKGYFVGVPSTAITSGVQGWYQIGGNVTSVTTPSITGTAGGPFRWVDESVNNGGAGSTDTGFVADFAICVTSASASTAHDMFLMARRVCGIT